MDASYRRIEKLEKVAGKPIEFRVAMRTGKCRDLSDTLESRLQDLVEGAKAHIRAEVVHPFRVIKQQLGFQKASLRGLAKNHCKMNVLAALTNLYMPRRQLLRKG